jgi:hypothetical protein
MNLANSNRHPDADTSLVSVERSDVIDAAAALALMARENRQASKLPTEWRPGQRLASALAPRDG